MRSRGISHHQQLWIKKTGQFLWEILQGSINRNGIHSLAEFFIGKYHGSSLEKCFNYSRAFLNHLYKRRMDPAILGFLPLLERPKTRQPIKLLTQRIITQDDIRSLIATIKDDINLDGYRRRHYLAFALFLAYTGQRPMTGGKITVKQIREALKSNPQVMRVEAMQDKIRLEHYVPLHPALIPFLEEVIKGKEDHAKAFDYIGLRRWMNHREVPMCHTKGKMEVKDLRKGFEQISDEIGFTDANKNYLMSHGVSGISWKSYKQFLPESVYIRYMDMWKNIRFIN